MPSIESALSEMTDLFLAENRDKIDEAAKRAFFYGAVAWTLSLLGNETSPDGVTAVVEALDDEITMEIVNLHQGDFATAGNA